jgi:hypothetical protein
MPPCRYNASIKISDFWYHYQMKVSVEYGHTYSSDELYTRGLPSHDLVEKDQLSRGLTKFEQACMTVGNDAARLAEEAGFEVKRHVLIDDVELAAQQHKSQDSERFQLTRARMHHAVEALYRPDEVVHEADLASDALRNIDLITQATGKDQTHVKANTTTGPQRIRLRGFRDIADAAHPSCDVLDLAWHQKRAQDAEVLITVLHQNYAHQQARVHALAELVADGAFAQISAATLLVDDDGQPSQLLRWQTARPEVASYFDSLEALISPAPNDRA